MGGENYPETGNIKIELDEKKERGKKTNPKNEAIQGQ